MAEGYFFPIQGVWHYQEPLQALAGGFNREGAPRLRLWSATVVRSLEFHNLRVSVAGVEVGHFDGWDEFDAVAQQLATEGLSPRCRIFLDQYWDEQNRRPAVEAWMLGKPERAIDPLIVPPVGAFPLSTQLDIFAAVVNSRAKTLLKHYTAILARRFPKRWSVTKDGLELGYTSVSYPVDQLLTDFVAAHGAAHCRLDVRRKDGGELTAQVILPALSPMD